MQQILEYITSVSPIYLITYGVLGFVFAILIVVSGAGAGVLLVPALMILFDQDPLTAVGTASLFAFVTKVYASGTHIYLKNVDYSIFTFIIIGSIPVILFSLALIDVLINYGFQEQVNSVAKIMIIVVILLSVFMIMHKKKGEKKSIINKNYFVLSGAILGVVMSLTGIGAGMVLVAFLKRATSLSIKKIVGTTILIACFLGLIIGVMYAQNNKMNMNILIFMLVGAFVAFPFSNFFIRIISDRVLELLVTGLLFLSAFTILITQLF